MNLFLIVLVGYIFYRLFQSLGNDKFPPQHKTDYERPSKQQNHEQAPKENLASFSLPAHVQKKLERVQKDHPTFSVKTFLGGVEQAYGLIIQAFYNNDLPTVRELVNNPVWFELQSKQKTYEDNVRKTGVRFKLNRVEDILITDVQYAEPYVTIGVKVEAFHDALGKDVKTDKINHNWFFEKNLTLNTPAWTLIKIAPPSKESTS